MYPDVQVPMVVTTVIHEGISPEDSERLLSKPAELELKTIDGIVEVTSFSSEGAATIMTEFDIDFETSAALAEVREAINRAKSSFSAVDRGTNHPRNVSGRLTYRSDCFGRRWSS